MENLIQRIERLSLQGVGTDIITPVLRSEGYSDLEIREAYDAIYASGDWDIEVLKMAAYYVRK